MWEEVSAPAHGYEYPDSLRCAARPDTEHQEKQGTDISHLSNSLCLSQCMHPQDGSYHLLIYLKAMATVIMVHSVQKWKRLAFCNVYF